MEQRSTEQYKVHDEFSSPMLQEVQAYLSSFQVKPRPWELQVCYTQNDSDELEECQFDIY